MAMLRSVHHTHALALPAKYGHEYGFYVFYSTTDRVYVISPRGSPVKYTQTPEEVLLSMGDKDLENLILETCLHFNF